MSIVLQDPVSGGRAEILPELGFNCHRLAFPSGDDWWEVLWSEEGFAAGEKRPSGSGIPVLFPFPGRLPGESFSYDDREYLLEAGDGRGNAIHGFVYNRPWEVVQQQGQRAAARFRASEHLPNHRLHWPADFEIRTAYTFHDRVLKVHTRMTNLDLDFMLPCGFGLHPYFRLPLGPHGAAEDCLIQVAATRRWPLQEMLPTGVSEPWEDAEAMRQGRRFADVALDDVLGGLVFDGDWCRCAITDPTNRRRVEIACDRAFANCVVYTPPHRQAICIEPYTCVPGAWLLDNPEAHAQNLAPGETLEATVTITARDTE